MKLLCQIIIDARLASLFDDSMTAATVRKCLRAKAEHMKWLGIFAIIFLTAFPLQAQPTNGPVYWSPTQPDCTNLGTSAVTIKNSAGTTLGYSCYVSGTFVWFAAGGIWGTTVRVAAPASAPIGVDYTFFDQSGNNLNLDSTINGVPSSFTSSNDVNFALGANKPAEVELLGATANAPAYGSTATGSVYAVIYCPDEASCENVLPQLLYSALPAQPWSLSVPLAFDTLTWTQWSAVGINNNGANPVHALSLVIYNEDTVATTYKVSVYDSAGNLVGTGTTPSVAPLKSLGNGNYSEGGTYGAYLSQIVSTLPEGVCKVVVDGGAYFSAVEVLQFNGPSATTLQVSYDSAPTTGTALFRPNLRRVRLPASSRLVFGPIPQ